jgi:hypothetical protein
MSRLRHFQVIFCTLMLTASTVLAQAPVAASSNGSLSKQNIALLQMAVFEVVVPKQEDAGIRYDHPFSNATQTFSERNDKYVSLGTAFAVGTDRFVSAAHVFGAHVYTLRHGFSLRDVAGNVYKIKDFTRYSNDRDLVEFNLETSPSSKMFLKIRKEVALGDTIYSVGNALGEGISLRGGQVASFTPEDVDGRWKFIRFSAPASPGNSGGPLVDSSGSVVGIITMKSKDENLNYAVPISELEKVSTAQTDFKIRDVYFSDGDHRLVLPWEFHSPLPANYFTIAKVAQQSLYSHSMQLNQKFSAQYKNEIFPYDPKFREYLKNQPAAASNLFSYVTLDQSKTKWNTQKQSVKKFDFQDGQHAFYDQGVTGVQMILEKPKKMSLAEFTSSPQTKMEMVLQFLPVYRKVGTDKLRITSFGKPPIVNDWEDELGRKWTTSIWMANYNDSFFVMHCLPTPRGSACEANLASASEMTFGVREKFRFFCPRVIVNYDGSESEWESFLQLGPNVLPKLFNGMSVGKSGGGNVHIKTADYEANAPLNEQGQIIIRPKYSQAQPLALELTYATFVYNKDAPSSLVIAKITAPDIHSPERKGWDMALARPSLVEQKAHSKDGMVLANKLIFNKSQRGPASVEESENYAYQILCEDSEKSSLKVMTQNCSQIISSFHQRRGGE